MSEPRQKPMFAVVNARLKETSRGNFKFEADRERFGRMWEFRRLALVFPTALEKRSMGAAVFENPCVAKGKVSGNDYVLLNGSSYYFTDDLLLAKVCYAAEFGHEAPEEERFRLGVFSTPSHGNVVFDCYKYLVSVHYESDPVGFVSVSSSYVDSGGYTHTEPKGYVPHHYEECEVEVKRLEQSRPGRRSLKLSEFGFLERRNLGHRGNLSVVSWNQDLFNQLDSAPDPDLKAAQKLVAKSSSDKSPLYDVLWMYDVLNMKEDYLRVKKELSGDSHD